MRVRLAVRAVEDISAARDWYDEVDPGLGAEFLTEVDRVLERLMMFPRSGAPVDGVRGVRRSRLRRFPYGIGYRLTGTDELWVLRVLHERRDPAAIEWTEGPSS